MRATIDMPTNDRTASGMVIGVYRQREAGLLAAARGVEAGSALHEAPAVILPSQAVRRLDVHLSPFVFPDIGYI